jgi:L-asparaginase
MRKHIYVAYTGGTIGMKPSKNGFVPAAGYLSKTLLNMPEFHRSEMPAFTIHEYDHLIDSSDMSPSDWQFIADDIAQHYADYDGFIILHGTDTMAYTSSALSFMLEDLSKPVIVTGSQIPLAELRSDGQTNLLNALYIAANYPIPEVTLFFNNKLYRGNRVRKVDADGFDAFDSPNFPALLEAGINIEVNHDVVSVFDSGIEDGQNQGSSSLSEQNASKSQLLENKPNNTSTHWFN